MKTVKILIAMLVFGLMGFTSMGQEKTVESQQEDMGKSISVLPKCFCCNEKIYQLPSIPPINGPAELCPPNLTYSTASCHNANFNWTIIPSSITFTGNGTSSITIDWNSVPLGTSVVSIMVEIRCGNKAVKNIKKVKVCKKKIEIKEGIDAMIHGLGGNQNTNYGQYPSNVVSNWTFDGTAAQIWSVIKFTLPTINPSNITSAKLYLKEHIAPSNGGHSTQYGGATKSTDFEIRRVTSTWTESGITWANGMANSTTNSTVTQPSYTAGTDDIVVDVTQLVKDMINNGNHGFMFRWKDDNVNQYYRSRWFGSFQGPPAQKPVLVIE